MEKTALLPHIEVSRAALLSITSDNRVHLFDLESGREKRSYVEKNNLTNRYMCSAWSADRRPLSSDSTDKKAQSLGLFAVGTANGKAIIWDLDRGIVSKTLQTGDNGNLVDICFSSDSKVIYGATSSNNIVKFDLATGDIVNSFSAGKSAPSKIVLNPKNDNVIAIASSSIRIVDMESSHKKKLDASFSGAINGLEFSTCGRYLVASSSSSREILVFDVQAGANSSPIASISLGSIPLSISVRSHSKKANATINIFCGLENRKACIVRVQKSQESVQHSIANIQGDVDVLTGGFTSGTHITLALGQASKPSFTTVALDDSDGSLLKAISISESDLQSVNGNKKTTADTVAVLGTADAGAIKRPLVDTDATPSKKSKTSSDLMMDVAIDANQGAQTLEQRLEAISSDISKQQAGQESLGGGMAVTPTSESLVALIEQALQSGDNTLLEQCLTCEDIAIIEETSKRLPSSRVVALLKKLVAKFEKRPSRGYLLTRWLQSLLRHHNGFLISVPDLTRQLAGLSQMLEQRLSAYGRLASLSGRLDLLMNQVSSQTSSANVDESETLQQESVALKPKKIYIEE